MDEVRVDRASGGGLLSAHTEHGAAPLLFRWRT
jgi:hypothetical protein